MINEIFKNPDGTQTIVSTPTGFFSKSGEDKDKVFNINVFKEKVLARFEKQFAVDFDAVDNFRFANPDLFDKETGLDFVSLAKIKNTKVDKEALHREGQLLGADANRINKTMDFTEQSLFNVLTPQAKNFIDKEHFNRLKKVGALDTPDFEYINRQDLRRQFQQKALEIYGDDNFEDVDISKINTEGMDDEQKANLKEEMNALILRELLLWSKYKFERL